MEFLSWLENLGPITWVRESDSFLGYTLYLAGHTIGLVFLVGPNLVIAARVLGLAPGLPLRPMASFRPVMTLGLWLTVITGSVLFATAPIGYVHNIVFIVKIAALLAAIACLRALVRGLFDSGVDPDAGPVPRRLKVLTVATLLLWTVGVVAGRLTAYSLVVVMASTAAFLVACGVATAVGALCWVVLHRRSVPGAPVVHPTPDPAVQGGN